MLFGPDGKPVTKMTWKQFTEYQRWDEFPERADDPPMIDDFVFWLNDQKYYCTVEDYGYILVDEGWHRLAYDKNFLNLLKQSVFDGKSFYDCIEDILFIE